MVKILHLEDEPLDCELVREWLLRDRLACEIDCVQTLDEFRAALERGGYELILSDYSLPRITEMEPLQLARQLRPELPFIFVSGTLGEDVAIETLKHGATDYVLKKRLARLAPAVRRALREAEEQRCRRRAEADLRKFHFFSENSNDGHFLIDYEARVRYANKLASERLGYTREELLKLTVPDIDPVFPLNRLQELFGRLQQGRVPPFEAIHKRKDGSTFPVEITSTVLEIDGELLMFSAVRDITDRKRAEQALEASERRMRALFEKAGVGIVEVMDDDRFIAVNERACEILGRPREELLRTNVHELTWPEDRELSDRQNGEVHAGLRDRVAYEKRYIRGDGLPVWVNATVSAVRDNQGRWTRSITTIEDITERKRAEEAALKAQEDLARANAELEAKVSERTAQLLEANVNLQSFAHTAAHDLRAPLRAIGSFSGILLEDYSAQLDATAKSYLERIARSAAQMGQLLTDLLEYSRITQAELKLEPVNLQEAAREALALLESESRARAATVTIEEPLPMVIGHPATVVLIINNFVANAIKFVSPGVEPRVRIWASVMRGDRHEPLNRGHLRWTSGERYVRVWIEDNGIGISPEEVTKVFGVFQRLHSKDAYPGTGLGLAIVQRGAERMGGHVGVESEHGSGSRFWFELKAA